MSKVSKASKLSKFPPTGNAKINIENNKEASVDKVGEINVTVDDYILMQNSTNNMLA